MAESRSRNAILVLALAAAVVALLLLMRSGDEESGAPSTLEAPNATRALPVAESQTKPARMDDAARSASANAATSDTTGTDRPTALEDERSIANRRNRDASIDQRVDVESVRIRMQEFDQTFPPELVEALRNPQKPELPPAELERLQNAVMPNNAEQEFLLQHGEAAEALGDVPIVLDEEESPNQLSPSELHRLQNPPFAAE